MVSETCRNKLIRQNQDVPLFWKGPVPHASRAQAGLGAAGTTSQNPPFRYQEADFGNNNREIQMSYVRCAKTYAPLAMDFRSRILGPLMVSVSPLVSPVVEGNVVISSFEAHQVRRFDDATGERSWCSWRSVSWAVRLQNRIRWLHRGVPQFPY